VVDPTAGRDFFISYTGVNRPWAEWIAVQLEAAGYITVLQSFDFREEAFTGVSPQTAFRFPSTKTTGARPARNPCGPVDSPY